MGLAGIEKLASQMVRVHFPLLRIGLEAKTVSSDWARSVLKNGLSTGLAWAAIR
jgi:hypothetical protein